MARKASQRKRPLKKDKRRDLCGEMSKAGAQPRRRARGWPCKKAIRLGCKVSKIPSFQDSSFAETLISCAPAIISDSTCRRDYQLNARTGSAIPAALGRLGLTFQGRWAGPVSPAGRGSRPTRPPEEPPAAGDSGRSCGRRACVRSAEKRHLGPSAVRWAPGVRGGSPGSREDGGGAEGVGWAWHTPGTAGLETGTGLGVPGRPLSRPRAPGVWRPRWDRAPSLGAQVNRREDGAGPRRGWGPL